jgi:hypothetical protein
MATSRILGTPPAQVIYLRLQPRSTELTVKSV